MSLVGPRPERPEFVVKLAQSVPNYMDRLAVLPGVTGLAQINLPADDSLESVRQKVVLDREYIQAATFTLDIRIFCCTMLRMTGLHHGVAPWLFGVDRNLDNTFQSTNDCCDNGGFNGSLDDTAINTPALIAVSLDLNTTVTATHRIAANAATHEQDQIACAVKVGQTVRAINADQTGKAASPAPRRPR